MLVIQRTRRTIEGTQPGSSVQAMPVSWKANIAMPMRLLQGRART